MLEKIQDPSLRVLVVWEPILPTDWERPTTAVLARIHIPGVVQFWDHEHLVAQEISRQFASDPGSPKPHCCTSRGNLWDFAALYAQGSEWRGAALKPVYGDGPVVDVQSNLSRDLPALLSRKNQSEFRTLNPLDR